ncbi:MAG: hypothetical protein ACRENS_02405 [Candidatus Eiseniibacteriota bacterium]
MTRFHLAPGTPWWWLLLATLGLAVLGAWAYRFALPPLPPLARRALPLLRFAALALLLWLLAQPSLELPARGGAHVVVLLDRSRSMDLPARAGGEARSVVAARAVESIQRALRGHASLEVLPFSDHLGAPAARDSAGPSTALGGALEELAGSEAVRRASAALVVSDGALNAGGDPVSAAQALGLPVHTVRVGEFAGVDRAVASLEVSAESRVGRAEPVRVHLTSDEPAGTPMPVHLDSGAHEIAHGTALSPGPGAEAVCELIAVPLESGLAIWTASVDSLAHEPTVANNSRSAALQVAAGRVGVLIVSAGLNWDLTFLRRSLEGDSGLAVTTWTREGSGWRATGAGGRRKSGAAARPSPQDLNGCAVVALDALNPTEVSPDFDRALASFVRGGGGLLVLGGPGSGLLRLRQGALGAELAVRMTSLGMPRAGTPEPAEQSAELTAWDDDPVRGREAWRAAAPLSDLMPIEPGPGDRVLIGTLGGGPPLLFARHVGRGQALLVNGTGVWRWSLSPTDDLAGERGRRLWRMLTRWLAEPVQGEPLRVRPERWLASSGEPVRLFATLQDSAFRPLAGARIEGEVTLVGGGTRALEFEPREAGTYVATLNALAPGRYRASVRARTAGREQRQAGTEFAIDRWSLEDARAETDSATLAAISRASGGVAIAADQASHLPGAMQATLSRGALVTARLWESPWVLAMVVAALAAEWAWRRRRGLP